MFMCITLHIVYIITYVLFDISYYIFVYKDRHGIVTLAVQGKLVVVRPWWGA